jgi:uncharacterized protein
VSSTSTFWNINSFIPSPSHVHHVEFSMKWTRVVAFTVTLLLTISGVAVARTRPQDPQPPFPYQSVEVSYSNSKAQGVHLEGTLVVPEGRPPFPTVMLINGSGLHDRDGTMFDHRPFAVIADYLARRGIASLRVDDRGFGESTGDARNATTADLAGDVEAGVAFLKTRSEVSPSKIGLIGHSEGGIIAPMVAAKPEHEIAFIVLLAGTGVTGDRVLLEQQTAILRASGSSTNEIESNRKVMETILPIVKTSEESREILLDRLVEAVKEIQPRMPERKIRRDMRLLTSSWVRFFVNYDPAPTLATVKCPVLALNGSKDVQVIPQQNLTAIEQTLERSGNPNFRTLELAGLNHLFQTAQTGAPDEYEEIEETFSLAALELIAAWIEQDAIGS